MRAKMLLFALSALAGFGQDANLVGLPEYGVELVGTIENPTIVNNSGKTIIGRVLRCEYGNVRGAGHYINLTTRGIRLNMKNMAAGLPPGGTQSPLSGDVRPRIASNSIPPQTITITRCILDAIVFADGQFVGPDEGHYFEPMANQVIAEQAVAERVAAGRNDPAQREAVWAEITHLVPPPPFRPQRSRDPQATLVEQARISVARDLLSAKNESGEAAAYDIADREMAIPKLWRAQQ